MKKFDSESVPASQNVDSRQHKFTACRLLPPPTRLQHTFRIAGSVTPRSAVNIIAFESFGIQGKCCFFIVGVDFPRQRNYSHDFAVEQSCL